jgi:hypothetical protein
MIAVITPWAGMAHLLPGYARATEGAVPIIVDTSEAPQPALSAFCDERGGVYCRETAQPFSYARACNLGLEAVARVGADVAVCLNNDVEGDPAWVADAARLPDGVLTGPELLQLTTAGQPHLYVAGWCVAATLATWEAVGRWDAAAFTGCYHEDVDLSWRAARAGVYLRRAAWPLRHLGEQTSRVTPGATAHHPHNREVFAARVRAWKAVQG